MPPVPRRASIRIRPRWEPGEMCMERGNCKAAKYLECGGHAAADLCAPAMPACCATAWPSRERAAAWPPHSRKFAIDDRFADATATIDASATMQSAWPDFEYAAPRRTPLFETRQILSCRMGCGGNRMDRRWC